MVIPYIFIFLQRLPKAGFFVSLRIFIANTDKLPNIYI